MSRRRNIFKNISVAVAVGALQVDNGLVSFPLLNSTQVTWTHSPFGSVSVSYISSAPRQMRAYLISQSEPFCLLDFPTKCKHEIYHSWQATKALKFIRLRRCFRKQLRICILFMVTTSVSALRQPVFAVFRCTSISTSPRNGKLRNISRSGTVRTSVLGS